MRFDRGSFNKFVLDLAAEYQFFMAIIREKGARHFSNAFGVGISLVLVVYIGVYRPFSNKTTALTAQIQNAKATVQYRDQYMAVNSELQRIYPNLVPIEKKQGWLTYAVLDTMKKEGLASRTLVPPTEASEAGLIFQEMAVSCEVSFAKLVSWLTLLEQHQPWLYVTHLELAKQDHDKIGVNAVNIKLATAVLERRMTP